MLIEVVSPARKQDKRGRAIVRPDGAVELPKAEARRMGIKPGRELEVARIPEGASLLTGDVCPRKAYVELTTACNLDCAMCLRRAFEEPGGEMALATFRRVVEQCAELPGLATLNFSGYGEPMSHPLFAQCLALAKGARFEVEAVSNGLLLTPERMKQLIDLRLDRLIISMDGLSGDASQNLHAGTFPTVEAALRAFHRMRFDRNVTHPEVTIEFVATKRNIAELPALVRLAPQLGFTGVLVTNLVPHTPELASEILYEQWATSSHRNLVTPWNPSVDLPLMDARSAATPVVERMRASGTHLRMNGAEVAGADPRCRFVAEGRLAIRWDGAVSPCLPLLHSHTHYFRDKAKRIRRYALGNINETRSRPSGTAPSTAPSATACGPSSSPPASSAAAATCGATTRKTASARPSPVAANASGPPASSNALDFALSERRMWSEGRFRLHPDSESATLRWLAKYRSRPCEKSSPLPRRWRTSTARAR